MTYSIIGILAAVILLITNRDIFWIKKGTTFTKTQRLYRRFLFGVLAYYLTDGLWGVFYNRGFSSIMFAETTLYFIAMAASVLFWTQYVNAYLESDNVFSAILRFAGWIFFTFEIIAITINIFYPSLFWFDESGAYQAGPMRHIMLIVQVLMFSRRG